MRAQSILLLVHSQTGMARRAVASWSPAPARRASAEETASRSCAATTAAVGPSYAQSRGSRWAHPVTPGSSRKDIAYCTVPLLGAPHDRWHVRCGTCAPRAAAGTVKVER